MHAILLVGGRGTRLQPLTDTRPKPMLPILGLPFLEHQLAHLRRHGVTAVTFACGFLPDAIERHFGDGAGIGIDLTYAIEPAPLDTAGAIAFAAHTIQWDGDTPGRLLVCNGDILTGLDIGALVAFHEQRGAAATIALTPVEDPSRYGLVRTTAEGAVTAFVEKPPPEECDTNLINAGTYLLEPGVLGRIPDGVRCNIEREVFPALVGEGLFAMADHSYWKDIGTPESYLAANMDMVAGVIDGAPGSVRIGAGAVVHPDADVADDVILGEGVVVEAGAQVRTSVVLERAVVRAAARIVGAIVGEGAEVGARVELSAGTVVAPMATAAGTS